MSDSPYASPRPVDEQSDFSPADSLPVPVLRRGILTVLLSSLLFALVGMFLGLMIGRFLPGYYIAVFPRSAMQNNFDPTTVGMGLGLTQGFGGGAVIGLIVVVATAWSYRRKSLRA